jgi:hypothetical protein
MGHAGATGDRQGRVVHARGKGIYVSVDVENRMLRAHGVDDYKVCCCFGCKAEWNRAPRLDMNSSLELIQEAENVMRRVVTGAGVPNCDCGGLPEPSPQPTPQPSPTPDPNYSNIKKGRSNVTCPASARGIPLNSADSKFDTMTDGHYFFRCAYGSELWKSGWTVHWLTKRVNNDNQNFCKSGEAHWRSSANSRGVDVHDVTTGKNWNSEKGFQYNWDGFYEASAGLFLSEGTCENSDFPLCCWALSGVRFCGYRSHLPFWWRESDQNHRYYRQDGHAEWR